MFSAYVIVFGILILIIAIAIYIFQGKEIQGWTYGIFTIAILIIIAGAILFFTSSKTSSSDVTSNVSSKDIIKAIK